MALLAGGGGGRPKTLGIGGYLRVSAPPAPPVSFSEEDEEERRRKLARLQAQMRLTRAEKRMNPTWDAPTEQIAERARQLQAQLSRPKDSLAEYWAAVRKLGGQDKMAQRLLAVKVLWDVYLKPFTSSRAIFDLARSDLSLSEIDAMLRAAHVGVFSGTAGTKLPFPTSFTRKIGIDHNNLINKAQLEAIAATSGFVQGGSILGKVLGDNWVKAHSEAIKDADWLLKRGTWGTTELDTVDKDREAVEKFADVPIEQTETFKRLRPDVQERIRWLWYNATGDPEQPTPYGRIDPVGRQEGWLRVYGHGEGWFPEGINDEEKKALEAALSLVAARWRVANAAQVEAERESRQKGLTGALYFGLTGAVGSALGALGEAYTAAREGAALLRGLESATQAASLGQRLATGALKASATGATMVGLSETVGSITESRGAERQALIEKKMAPVERTVKEEPEKLPYAAQELQDLLSHAHGLPQTNALAMQKQIQEGIYDVDPITGEKIAIVGGYGKDLEPNGLWTPEWDQALTNFWADMRRHNVEIQRKLIESGYATLDLPIDGILEGPKADPRWVQALERAREDIRKQLDFAKDHPVLYKFLQTTGVPLTVEGARAWINRIFQTGPLTGVLDLLTLEPLKTVGGVYNAVLSALTFATAQAADREYQRLKDEWLDAVANGSSDAEEKKRALLERQAFLLENAFVPDPIMQVSIGLGKDVQDAIEWSRNHPNWVLAASLARDVALMPVTAKLTKVARGRIGLEPTREAFLRSIQPNSRIGEMLNYVRDGKLYLAEQVVGGNDAHLLVNTVQDLMRGKLTSAAKPGVESIARTLLDAADRGDLGPIKRITTLNTAEAEAFAESLKAVKPKSGLSGDKAVESRVTQAAKFIVDQNRATGGALLDMQRVTKEIAADMWQQGKVIFPYLHKGMEELPRGSKLNRKLISAIADVENPTVRHFLSVGLRQFQLKPMREVPLDSVYGARRVFSNALLVYDDAAKALDVASRWVRDPRPAARIELAEQVKKDLVERFQKLEAGEPPQPATGVDPLTGEVIAKDRVGLPVYLSYTADFGPVAKAMHALIKTADLPFGQKILTKYMVNPARKIENIIQVPSNVARQWTVALGPMLFVKHSIADTTRTIVSEGLGSMLKGPRLAKEVDNILTGVDPQVASEVRHIRERAKVSEQHFHVGNVERKVDWSGTQIYQEVNGKWKPVNMARGVEALRRIASDPVFVKYVDGGEEAVRAWLNTKEGKDFMYRGGHVAALEKVLEEQDIRGVKQSDVYKVAVETYIHRYVRGLLDGLASVAPRITEGLAEMAQGKRPLTESNIKRLVEEVNREGVAENPYLSIPEEAPVEGTLNKATAAATHMIGMWMTPNRLNRQAVFNHVFVKSYKDLVKAGMEPNNAARVAAALGELNTARIHFDLANAAYAEAAHRWIAWFATKHRLYNTYLLKTFSQRPSIAGAAQTFFNWIEKRNEDKNLPDWDKHSIVIPLDWLPDNLPMGWGKEGSALRLNLSTLFWLNHTALESSMTQALMAAGAKVADLVPGVEVPIPQPEFGYTTGRWDRLIQNLALTATAVPLLTGEEEDSEKWLREWFEGEHGSGLSDSARKRVQKAMNIQMATAQREGREMTPVEAFKAALLGSLLYEAIQMGKVWPGRIVSGDERYYEDALAKFNKLSPEERYNKLDEDPSIRFLFGLYSTNPVDQYAIAQGWQKIAKIFKERAASIEDAYDTGTIYDKTYMQSIYDYYDDKIRQITDPNWRDPNTGESSPEYNEVFAKVWNESNLPEMTREDMIATIFPLADPRAVTLEGYVPNETQKAKKKKELQDAFEEAAKNLGLNPADTSDPYVAWLKKKMVTEPLAEFMKYQDGEGWQTNLANSIARDLARGKPGPAAKADFLTQLQNEWILSEYAKGTEGSSSSGVSGIPMFATMTTKEKEAIGWKSTSKAEELWQTWCQAKSQIDRYLEEHGISVSSKKGKEIRAQLDQLGQILSQQDQTFAIEWQFSKLPLWKRLEVLGVGRGNKPVDQAWESFLALVNAYHEELDNTWNRYTRSYGVTGGSQAAYPIAMKYLPRIVDLKRYYPDWWEQLRRLFGSLSKFGFVRWRMPGDIDDELWYGTDVQIYEPSEGGEL